MLGGGAVFAGYTVLRFVGSGPMGEVYLARHAKLPRQDALKILSAAASEDRDYRDSFNRAADGAATLIHPNIVRVHAHGEFDGRLWIATDYIDGTDAWQLMKTQFPNGMPAVDVCMIVTAISEALDYAHQRGVPHHDVKPTNILITEPVDGWGRALLTDFAIARQPGGAGGLASADVDGRTDQYGLAATAYQLLVGARPGPTAGAGRQLPGWPPKLGERRPDLAHLDPVFARALANNPADRFNRCRDFADALNGVALRTRQHKRSKRFRILAGSALAAVLLVAGVAIGHVVTQPKNNGTSTSAAGFRPPNALAHPPIDPSLLPADGPPGPMWPMKQTAYCTEVGVLPDTDFRVPPKYMDTLNLPAAWRFGRGGGVKVAVIDTGVNPQPRFPHLVGGGDYVFATADGLSDCDGRGTIVASMIGAAPSSSDAFSGIAPDVDLISIRASSESFTSKNPDSVNRQTQSTLDSIHTLARAVVHAANMGAAVINISAIVCTGAYRIPDEGDLGAAVRYAAVDKNAVIVAAAGDTSQRDCAPNPVGDHGQVETVVTPDWFDEYVLTVGATDSAAQPLRDLSLAGPWVSVAAPGSDVVGLSPRDDTLINAIRGPGSMLLVPMGTSFSAPIVSGVAALVRAKYPQLSSRQIINRLVRTARPPVGGRNEQIGYGVVDPVAALTKDVPKGPR
jgi:membrane-anchored mycosin MYCP